jgi:hypothetical protein
MAGNPTTPQNNTSHGQAMSPPCCPPAASHFPHQPLAACHLPPNPGVGHCCLTPGQSSGFDQCTAHCPNKIKKESIICLNCLNTILATPRQQLSAMGDDNGNGDGQWRWRLQLPTVTKTAMADGDGDGNGNG